MTLLLAMLFVFPLSYKIAVSYTVKYVYEASNRIIYSPYEIDDGNSVTLDMARSNKREFFMDQEVSKTGGPENFGYCFMAWSSNSTLSGLFT